MMLYCFVAYLVMYGMLISHYKKIDDLHLKDWVCFMFSPIILPIIIGIILSEK